MKKLVGLFLFCSMMISFVSFAQTEFSDEFPDLAQLNFNASGGLDEETYYPFLKNSTWYTADQGFEGYMNSVFTIEKDTTFNEFTYSKIVEKFIGLQGVSNNRATMGGGKIVYLIREDVPNKKVYQYFRFVGDVLLYDFALEVGASLPDKSEYELKTVDLVEGPDGPRKRFTFKDKLDVHVIWIEGIGNISAPFISYASIRDWQKLICASQNGTRTYEFVNKDGITCNSFDQATATKDKDLTPDASIYPNPTGGKFRIVFNEKVSKEKTIRITDINGKTVFMKDEPQGSDYTDTDLSALPEGLYFCLISSEGNTASLKIIKR